MTCPTLDPMARAQFHAQVLATVGVDPEWDKAALNFLSWDLRGRAHGEYGPTELARQERDREKYDIEQRLGVNWRQHPEGKPVWERMLSEGSDFDDDMTKRLYEPMWESHRQLVGAPAPSMAAVIVKAAIIEIHEVWNDGVFARDCAAIIDDDLARLIGEKP